MEINKTYNQEDVLSLIKASFNGNQITEIEFSAYKKLSQANPIEVYQVVSQRMFQLGFGHLSKKAPKVLESIPKTMLSVLKTTYVLTLNSSDFDVLGLRIHKPIFDETIILINQHFGYGGASRLEQKKGLDRKKADAIAAEQESNYKEILNFDSSVQTLEAVEKDILRPFLKMSFQDMKQYAPMIFIKEYYPTFYKNKIEPHIDEIKKTLNN